MAVVSCRRFHSTPAASIHDVRRTPHFDHTLALRWVSVAKTHRPKATATHQRASRLYVPLDIWSAWPRAAVLMAIEAAGRLSARTRTISSVNRKQFENVSSADRALVGAPRIQFRADSHPQH